MKYFYFLAVLTPLFMGPENSVHLLISSSLEDTSHKSIGTCYTWGEGAFRTFQNDFFYFTSKCNFVLSRQCKGLGEDFNIQIRRGYNGNLEDMHMKIEGVSVIIKNKTITVKDMIIQLPYDDKIITVQKYGVYTRFSNRKHTIALIWNQRNSLSVILDAKYKNQTCGLCGNFQEQMGISSDSNDALYNTIIANQLDVLGQVCVSDKPTPSTCTAAKSCLPPISLYFSTCLDTFSLTGGYLELCKKDVCARGNKQEYACDTFEELSRQCTNQPVTSEYEDPLQNFWEQWRSKVACVIPSCPGNQLYKECGALCVPSCSDPETQQQCDRCVNTCECPKGTVLDDIRGSGWCIKKSACPCEYGGKIYEPGQIRNTSCHTCICHSGMWNCSDISCPGRCKIEEGSHITTFDNKYYTMKGDCSYYAVVFYAETNAWNVVIEVRPCQIAFKETCLHRVVLSNQQSRYTLTSDGSVYSDGNKVGLPLRTADIIIFQQSSMFLQVATAFGLKMQVQTSPLMQLYISLPEVLQGHTRGLCGTFNDNANDDFLSAYNIVENAPLTFANSWAVENNCPPPITPDPCISLENEHYAEQHCSLLKNPAGAFSVCHSTVDYMNYYQMCVAATCACENINDCLCAALGAYAHECAANGVIVRNWRSKICNVSCSNSQVYQDDMRACNRTCRSLSENDYTCKIKDVPVYGCGCSEQKYLDEHGVCVEQSNCLCYYEGWLIENGQSVRKNGTLCICQNGHLHCRKKPDPEPPGCKGGKVMFDCTNGTASSSEDLCKTTCRTLNIPCKSSCVPGCACPHGLVEDDNKNCISPENCPCFYHGELYTTGKTIQKDCNKCTCQGGLWSCTNKMCPRTCEVYGDGHYITFDGKRYVYDGNCEYIFVEDQCNRQEGTLQILTENVPCCERGMTCSRNTRILLEGKEIILTDNRVVTTEKFMNDTQCTVNSYSLHTVGLYLILAFSNGITVIWDKNTRLSITLDSRWKNRVCGLCGNFNDDVSDDMTTKGNSLVSNAVVFGNSWKSMTCSDTVNQTSPCERNPYCSAWSLRKCDIIKNSMFQSCHSKVDPTPYHKACVEEACACDLEGKYLGFCTAVAMYAEACNKAGVCVDWRTPDRCPVYCDYFNTPGDCSWHYKPCGTLTARTCSDHEIRKKFSAVLEGCYAQCPKARPYLDENTMKCVKLSDCTCYYNGEILKPGEERNDCRNCTCIEGKIICKDNPTTTTEISTIVSLPPTTTEESTATSLPTTTKTSTATSLPTTTKTLTATSLPTTTEESTATSLPTTTKTSTATSLPTTTEESTAKSLPTTTKVSTATSLPTTTKTSTATRLPTTTEESTATSLPTTTEESTAKSLPTTTKVSTATSLPTTTKTSTATSLPTTTEESTATSLPTTTKTSTATSLPTTTKTSTATSLPTTTEESTATSLPTTTKTSTATSLPTTTEESTAKSLPTTTKVSTATSLPTTTKTSTATRLPTTTEESTATSLPTTTEESTAKSLPTTTKVSTATSLPTTTKTSTATSLPTTTEESTATSLPTTTKTSTATSLPTTTKTSTATSLPTTTEESTAKSLPTTTKTSTATSLPTTTEESTATSLPTTTKTSTATSLPTTTEESTAKSLPTTTKVSTATSLPTTTKTSTATSLPTTTEESTATSLPTTTKTSTATSLPTTTEESTATSLPTTTKTSTATSLPTTTEESTATSLPTTTKTSTATSLPTTTEEPTATSLPTTTKTSTATSLPTTTEESTATSLPTTTKTSTATSLPTTTKTSTATSLPTTTKMSTATSLPTTTKVSTATSLPTTTKTSTATSLPTTTEESTATSLPTTTKTSTATSLPTTTEESTATSLPTTTKTSTATSLPTTTEESTATSLPTTTKMSTATSLPTTTKVSTATSLPTTTKTSTATSLPPTTTEVSTATSPATTTTEESTATSLPTTTKMSTATSPFTTTTKTPTSTEGCSTWSKWYNENTPSLQMRSDTELLNQLPKPLCPYPNSDITDIQCEAVKFPQIPISEMQDNVTCDKEIGLVCTYNPETSKDLMCLDYRIRVCCVPYTPSPSSAALTTVMTTNNTVPTTPSTTSLQTSEPSSVTLTPTTITTTLLTTQSTSTVATSILTTVNNTLPTTLTTSAPQTCVADSKPTCQKSWIILSENGCEKWDCYCECLIWGDPHYLTFGGTQYNFFENCTYILVEERVPKYNFSILVDNYFCFPGIDLSCARQLTILYNANSVIIQTNDKRRITFDDKVVTAPYSSNGINIQSENERIYIAIPDILVNIMASGNTFQIRLSQKYFLNNTQGQCGSCLDNAVDECRRRRGEIMPTDCCHITANDWKVSDPNKPYCESAPMDLPCTPPPIPPPPCEPKFPLCNLLLEKPFEKCRNLIPQEVYQYYNSCLFDQCNTNATKIACASLQACALACRSISICVDWRTLTNGYCKYSCPNWMVYEPCASQDNNDFENKQEKICRCWKSEQPTQNAGGTQQVR
ncbi:mucin-2-like isoform X2 [Hypanus sabinus]|uniref:mucin-2-like isoform X2 n=1 Tax=Hypanus sabinus TaxID=79690 RepID=UPI0028C4DE16|nr:mucin-2-like isoform X2 [Hypanus sabinus]